MHAALDKYAAAYDQGVPLVSDDTFDRLVDECAGAGDPYDTIGADPTDRAVELPFFLASLDKVKTPRDVARWSAAHPGPYLVQDKVDGITLLYTGRALYTRGGGVRGQDVSHAIPALALPPTNVSVRGEAVMRRELFEKFHDGANARNVVSGLFSQRPESFSTDTALSVEFLAFRVMPEDDWTPDDHHVWCRNQGFRVPYTTTLDVIDHETLVSLLHERRADAPYDIDGLVIRPRYRPVVHRPTRNPVGAIAFKHQLQSAETTVTGVEWVASKSRRLVPTIHVAPVTLNGATIAKTSGDNARYIRTHEIGAGTTLDVALSGDVIPRVVGVVNGSAASVPDAKYTFDGVHYVLDDETDDVRAAAISHFVSQLEIKHLGKSRARILAEHGVDTAALLAMTKHEWAQLPGIGPPTAATIVREVRRRTRNVPLANVMAASNVFPGFGAHRLGSIVERYPDVMETPPSETQLRRIAGLKTLAAVFVSSLESFRGWWRRHPSLTRRELNVTDRVIVLSGFRDASMATTYDARIADTVTEQTTLVIASDPESTSKKVARARKLGIPVVGR